jgi:transcriptional regulator with XRE-family HTH domain
MPRSPQPQEALGIAIWSEREYPEWRSQAQVAEEAGVRREWLSRLESGQVNPLWSTVRQVADALGTLVEVLAEKAEQIEEGDRPDLIKAWEKRNDPDKLEHRAARRQQEAEAEFWS